MLNISRTNQISKIENLQCLTKLQVLNLQVNRITKLQGLDNCVNLKILQLGNNKIQNVEYLSVQNSGRKILPLLTDLSLFKNEIQIWPVSNINLYFLRSLTLSDNKLATFSLAGWSPFLQILNLSQNLIFSLNGFHLAQNIQQIDLSFNKINSPASLMKNLVWISGSLKKLKINDNPFWRDAAMVGQSLAQIELSQQSELVQAERDMWKTFLFQIAPNLEELNSTRVLNKEGSDRRLFCKRNLSKDNLSENTTSQLIFRNSYLMKSAQFAYYWRKKNAKIFIKQSIPFKTITMRSKMLNYFSNMYAGLFNLISRRDDTMNNSLYSLKQLYTNSRQIKHQQKALGKITTLLSQKVLRKKIITRRASLQPKKLIKLQSFIRGFITRINYGQSIQNSLAVGRKKFRLSDPKHRAARKIQRWFKKFTKENKIKKALAKVGNDQFQLDNLFKGIEDDQIADFIENPNLFDQQEKKMLERETDNNLFGMIQFNQENYQRFIQARSNNYNQSNLETTIKNQNMLQSNNQYFYNNSPPKDSDNLTEIDAKSESSYGGASQLQSQRRLVKKNNLIQSNGYSTPFKSKSGSVNQSQSQFNHSPSSFLNIPNGQQLMDLERKKLQEEKKKINSEISKASEQWGFANQETKKILAMRKQKKIKQKEKSKKLSSEEKFMKFKINQQKIKQKGQSIKPPLRPERISYF